MSPGRVDAGVLHPGARLREAAPPLAQAVTGCLVVYSPDAPESATVDRWLGAQPGREGASRSAVGVMGAACVGIAFVDELSAHAHRREGLVIRIEAGAPTSPIYSAVNVRRLLPGMGRSLLRPTPTAMATMQTKRIPFGGRGVEPSKVST